MSILGELTHQINSLKDGIDERDNSLKKWFFREFCGKGVEKEEKIEEAIPKKG